MKIRIGFLVIWSDNKWLIPMKNVIIKNNSQQQDKEYNIGYTNQFNNFTYRLKPFITIKTKKK